MRGYVNILTFMILMFNRFKRNEPLENNTVLLTTTENVQSVLHRLGYVEGDLDTTVNSPFHI
jgi:hypothetical protein